MESPLSSEEKELAGQLGSLIVMGTRDPIRGVLVLEFMLRSLDYAMKAAGTPEEREELAKQRQLLSAYCDERDVAAVARRAAREAAEA